MLYRFQTVSEVWMRWNPEHDQVSKKWTCMALTVYVYTSGYQTGVQNWMCLSDFQTVFSLFTQPLPRLGVCVQNPNTTRKSGNPKIWTTKNPDFRQILFIDIH